ncbi:MAG: hypothetical protein JW944_09265 [Deltaproteobacteria bacterium]|nr:hypothetical protein [Deltaproteobacteria bacterium]
MADISYRFSSQKGDVIADEDMLNRKFAVGPSEFHPSLTLRDFFECVRRFLLPENGASCLQDILSGMWQRPVNVEEIETIIIRYEKYGTLYQICSIDVSAGKDSARLCANLAFTESAKQTLEREFELLSLLRDEKAPDFLPRAHKKDNAEMGAAGRSVSLLIIVLEWFEGYEEWHFRAHEGSTRAFLWDMKRGYHFLSKEQTSDMALQASRILTIYYDVQSMRRITPWHHGGGDFIVRASGEGIDLKLVTARGYEPIGLFKPGSLLDALCSFFIELITKMRLDKWEGLGESTWADRFVLEAAVKGFIEALHIKESRGEMGGLSAADVLQRLKSFNAGRLHSLVKEQLLDIRGNDLSDYMAVRRHLDNHVEDIYAVIQSF